MARTPRQRPTASADEAGPKGTAEGGTVRVRMYRHGLGDCFVVSVIQPPRKPFHMMIDCGVILGTPDAKGRLATVIDDIIQMTGSRVDVLVVTHEHYDHVSGFVLCDDRFAPAGQAQAGKLSVGEVWFAWTEKPGDPLAQQLRDQRQKRTAALAGMVARLDGMGAAEQDGATQIVQALRFFGVDASGEGAGKMGATPQAMNFAKQLSPNVTYWDPGQSWVSDGVPGVKIYVLGPPRDDKALHRTDSTTEVYHLDAGFLEDAVALAAGPGGADGARAYAPFDSGHRRPLMAILAGKDALLGKDIGATAGFIRERYLGPGSGNPDTDVSWRRIDDAWLGNAEQLALALDSATNNTSLVLAIELVASGKVLLFPADAQVGNWLSWHALQWTDADKTVSTADLLARTRFYKVGHHGSHNATLKEKGLEMMPAAGLVAFIPVDEAMAKVKRWFEMPLGHLLDALHAHCGDAVIRTDKDLGAALPGVSSGGSGGPFGSLYHEWVQAL